MLSFIAVAEGFHTMGFPLLAIMAMFASKLTTGTAGRIADRWFIALLALQGLITLRTVMHADTTWLIHMGTLMLLIVGPVVIPSLRHPQNQPVK
ncbi:hypothetical protein [Roseimaritima ulvae]|uniref:NnrS protein n=1 Tax=Roseimaritima ulvae TaxID=980254 RepID=A0A5B9QMC4_9BACT|nr:hypothetical protein [Roseimaritima ulvae]QEG40267.1 hypothetical protein UC8_22740 [Roseimaritima ulvae]